MPQPFPGGGLVAQVVVDLPLVTVTPVADTCCSPVELHVAGLAASADPVVAQSPRAVAAATMVIRDLVSRVFKKSSSMTG